MCENKDNFELTAVELSKNLVDIRRLSEDFEIEMKYASKNNFTGQKIYSIPLCSMQIGTARKLIKANSELMEKGYRIKIWDAYRPFTAQKIMWEIVPNGDFVANPNKGGSIHNCGFAVDVTLVDMNGRELEMPSEFDDFSEKASRNNINMTEIAAKNLALLTDTMVRNGFRTITSEWWHYYDEDFKERIPIDIPLEKLKEYKF
jgi:D-alanyl-D-alanine dipeptidase